MENTRTIEASEYCEICKQYLAKMEELKLKKIAEIEKNPGDYSEDALSIYINDEDSAQKDCLDLRFRTMFKEDYAEADRLLLQILDNVNNITISREIGEQES